VITVKKSFAPFLACTHCVMLVFVRVHVHVVYNVDCLQQAFKNFVEIY